MVKGEPLVSRRYGRGSIMLTSNLELRCGDQAPAGEAVLWAAMLDRPTHRMTGIRIGRENGSSRATA